MTHGDQTQQDVSGPPRPLHPNYKLKVGNWNVRMLYRSGNIAQAARETYWTGQGKVQLAEGETTVYSGRDVDNHRQGVSILMSKSTV